MKIQREVNGQVLEFELTSEELLAAFEEQEHLYDIQDVKNKFEGEIDPNEFEDEHGFPMDLVMDNQDLLDEMAWESRHNQDKHGMEWQYARDDAIKDIIEKHRDFLIASSSGQLCPEVQVHDGLPEMCYSVLESSGELIVIERGKPGYLRTPKSSDFTYENYIMADFYNDKLGVTKAQESAMFAGSLFGWHVPAANPEMYDASGKLKRQAASLEDQIGAAEQLKGSLSPSVGLKEKGLDDR